MPDAISEFEQDIDFITAEQSRFAQLTRQGARLMLAPLAAATLMVGCSAEHDDSSESTTSTENDPWAGTPGSYSDTFPTFSDAPVTTNTWGEQTVDTLKYGYSFPPELTTAVEDTDEAVDGTSYRFKVEIGKMLSIRDARAYRDVAPILKECGDLDKERDIVVPIRFKVMSTTKDFEAPGPSMDVQFVMQDGMGMSIYDGSTYTNDGSKCEEDSSNLSTIAAKWSKSLQEGDVRQHQAIVVIRNYYQPAHPEGAFDWLFITGINVNNRLQSGLFNGVVFDFKKGELVDTEAPEYNWDPYSTPEEENEE